MGMRWVVAQPGPSWSVHDVFVGWVEALRALGEQVTVFNFDDRLAFYDHAVIDTQKTDELGRPLFRKAVTGDAAAELAMNGLAAMLFKVRPDILMLVSGFFVPAELLDVARAYGIRVVVLHTEEPYEVERELALAGHADLNLINDPTHMARFAAIAPTVFVPHAYRPALHHPGPGRPELAADFSFVGTGFGSRRWFLRELQTAGCFDDIDVLLAGNWLGLDDDDPLRKYIAADDVEKCCDNEDTADIYRSGKVGLNLYRREHDQGAGAAGLAMGPREVEMAACGMFFLRDPRAEGDEVLSMLPTFEGPDDCGEKLAWWLGHDAERAEVAGLAHAAIQDRTFEASAMNLLRLFDRQPVTPKGK
jgi:spore maturation protein CgeB